MQTITTTETLAINKVASKNVVVGLGKIDKHGVYTVTIQKAYFEMTKNGDPMINLQIRTDTGKLGFLNGLGVNEQWHNGSTNYYMAQTHALLEIANKGDEVVLKDAVRIKNGVEVATREITSLLNSKLQVAVKYDKAEDRLRLIQVFDMDNKNTVGDATQYHALKQSLEAL